jgi:hypothetical protein
VSFSARYGPVPSEVPLPLAYAQIAVLQAVSARFGQTPLPPTFNKINGFATLSRGKFATSRSGPVRTARFVLIALGVTPICTTQRSYLWGQPEEVLMTKGVSTTTLIAMVVIVAVCLYSHYVDPSLNFLCSALIGIAVVAGIVASTTYLVRGGPQ